MNIIANDCVGGFIYKQLNESYHSPFIWTVLRFKDFKTIYEKYDEIEWKNVEYDETPNYFFPYYMSQLNVDNKFRIFFPHHIKMDGYPQLEPYNNIPGQSNYVYSKMDEYILEKYKSRVDRMLKEEPVFIYSQENRNTDEEIEKVLKTETKHKLILLTTNKDFLKYSSDRIVVLIKERNEIPQDIQAKYIINNISNFLKG